MKLNKILLVAFVSVISLFAFVSCTDNNSVLNDLLSATNKLETVSDSYMSTESETINQIQDLSYANSNGYLMELSETESELSIFIDLRFQLIDIHQEILDQRLIIKDLRESIRDSVITLKDGNYMLLDDDKDSIRISIDTLKTYRLNLLDTQGQAYARIYELRGTYIRDNLSNINQVFTEVLEVLEYRLVILENAIEDLTSIDGLLLEYLES